MAVESAADRAAYFDTDEFGVLATWSEGGTVAGMLVQDFTAIGFGDGPDAADHAFMFRARAADLSGVAIGQTLTVDSVVYTIRTIDDDGQGILSLKVSLDA